jgi:hypothetical protein
MLARRFSPPWFAEDIGGCFVVKANTTGRRYSWWLRFDHLAVDCEAVFIKPS